jgi:hypothetical protein
MMCVERGGKCKVGETTVVRPLSVRTSEPALTFFWGARRLKNATTTTSKR